MNFRGFMIIIFQPIGGFSYGAFNGSKKLKTNFLFILFAQLDMLYDLFPTLFDPGGELLILHMRFMGHFRLEQNCLLDFPQFLRSMKLFAHMVNLHTQVGPDRQQCQYLQLNKNSNIVEGNFEIVIVITLRYKDDQLILLSQFMSEAIEIDIGSIINRLLEVKHFKPDKVVKLQEGEILGLIRMAKDVFMQQNMLVEVRAPVKICGDIHGQYADLLRMFEYGGFPPQSSYLFLGDYVDRGRQGIQSICLLYAYKILYPNHVYLLRGNHETASITRIYGFFEQCKKRYSTKLWRAFIDCFNCMPVSALVEDKIICMHGGLSPELIEISQINSISRPVDVPDVGLLCDLLWADPESSIKGWNESERGVSYVFGADVVTNFLKKNDLDLICRAHQVVEDGYEFFNKKQLVTIFSAPNYCGEFNNSGALMNIEQSLSCSFRVLRPEQKMAAFKKGRPKTPIKRGG